jgi:ribosomal protein L44E
MPTKLVFVKYLCDICPQVFDTKYDCIVHERQHNDQEVRDETDRRYARSMVKRRYPVRSMAAGFGAKIKKGTIVDYDDHCENAVVTSAATAANMVTNMSAAINEILPKSEAQIDNAFAFAQPAASCGDEEQLEGQLAVLLTAEKLDEFTENRIFGFHRSRTLKAPQLRTEDLMVVEKDDTVVNEAAATGAKPPKTTSFHCALCKKHFPSKVKLLRHIRIHTRERCFQCTQCSFSHYDKSLLKKHIDKMHDQIRYACDKCWKMFSLKSARNRHLKVVHFE